MSEIVGKDGLISVINDLQNIFGANYQSLGIELPQITVVGGQGAGKSSVLESLVGKDFLPRGEGIVTRRPLIIQMHHNDGEEWAEFSHTGTKLFYDFSEVRLEIQEETDRELGENKEISRKPISLKIYSPKVLDLTLIDLPGLATDDPTDDDQPEDIQKKVKDIICEYIRQKHTIILAVTPANQDLTTSDAALDLARQCDPSGKRTIGVITKLDLMEEEGTTNILDILEGKSYKLAKGYIGVVNRSQTDIDDSNKTIDDAMKSEQEFFLNKNFFHLRDKMGSKYLQQYLSEELMRHIRNNFPYLLPSLKKKLHCITEQLKVFGYKNNGSTGKISLLSQLIRLFVRDVAASLEGNSVDVSVNSPKGGYEINKIIYGEVNDLLFSVVTEPVDDIISHALSNLGGFRGNVFPHQLAFDISVKKIVEEYQAPAKIGVDIIKTIMLTCVEESAENWFKPYPKLHDAILSHVRPSIEDNARLTTENVNVYLNAQAAFINIRHPDFIQEISPFVKEIKFLPNGAIPSHNENKLLGNSGNPQSAAAKIDSVAGRSSFSNDPSGRKQGLKNGHDKLGRSTECINANKTKNSWSMKKLFETKRQILDSVKDDPMIQDQTFILHQMIKSYIKVINTAIMDIIPKYIILHLVRGTISFVELQLEPSLFEDRETNEDKLGLLEIGEYQKHKIDELLVMEDLVRKAIEVIKDVRTSR